jgi:hypothetical protein
MRKSGYPAVRRACPRTLARTTNYFWSVVVGGLAVTRRNARGDERQRALAWFSPFLRAQEGGLLFLSPHPWYRTVELLQYVPGGYLASLCCW